MGWYHPTQNTTLTHTHRYTVAIITLILHKREYNCVCSSYLVHLVRRQGGIIADTDNPLTRAGQTTEQYSERPTPKFSGVWHLKCCFTPSQHAAWLSAVHWTPFHERIRQSSITFKLHISLITSHLLCKAWVIWRLLQFAICSALKPSSHNTREVLVWCPLVECWIWFDVDKASLDGQLYLIDNMSWISAVSLKWGFEWKESGCALTSCSCSIDDLKLERNVYPSQLHMVLTTRSRYL